MDVFKSTEFTWWQLGALKWAVICIGIVIGAKWSEFFLNYLIILLGVSFVLTGYLVTVWIKNK